MNSNYWYNKDASRLKAQQHTVQMENKYINDIMYSCQNTITYSEWSLFYANYFAKDTKIIVDDCDSIEAIRKHSLGKTAVLNFASYKNPGGRFLDGSMAQEECLCHSSFLYNVLSRFEDYYSWNNMNKNKGLYTNRALYSPKILFLDPFNNPFFCDVITCAAPNKSIGIKYKTITQQENSTVLLSRIKFVLDIAIDREVDTLILGAFGCGVFKQDPYEVASIFKKYLEMNHYKAFDKVVFAIPRGNNYDAFCKVFNNKAE